MQDRYFRDITTWVFDLDNTLYSPEVRLFDQIEKRMTNYVMRTLRVSRDRADFLRRHYWEAHGTTLAGLMSEHQIDPEPYLVDVHDISFDALKPDPVLIAALSRLPGRRIVYTNGSAPYARNVLSARGLQDTFDAVYGVEDAGFRPKPDQRAFETVFAKDGLAPQSAAMFEDEARNLIAPHAMGMQTVHVTPKAIASPHIHHHTADLAGFLSQIVA